MTQDLDRCKEMINLNMQRDVDYDKMTDEERESLVGPVRLASLHRALKEIGVSYFQMMSLDSFYLHSCHLIAHTFFFLSTESSKDSHCYSFDNWSARGAT